uniref:Uncharacterized protein n=1 Tax=Arcella intermedia TaxID=1963864 RepID=A0A6B2LYF2_9EUKA
MLGFLAAFRSSNEVLVLWAMYFSIHLCTHKSSLESKLAVEKLFAQAIKQCSVISFINFSCSTAWRAF